MNDARSPISGTGAGESSNEARLEAVLESISDGFYALDSDWRYVVFQPWNHITCNTRLFFCLLTIFISVVICSL